MSTTSTIAQVNAKKLEAYRDAAGRLVDGVVAAIIDPNTPRIDLLGPGAFVATHFGDDSEESLVDEQKRLLDDWISFVRLQRSVHHGEDGLVVLGACRGGNNRSALFAGWAKRALEGSIGADDVDVLPLGNAYFAAILTSDDGLAVDAAAVRRHARKRGAA